MNQLSMDFSARVQTSRRLGAEAGERSRCKADKFCPEFSARALSFIAGYARQHSTFTGEAATNAMKMAGIRAHDDRAVGPVFYKAIKSGLIRVVGIVPRVKGHGSSGGKLYAAGRAS